MFHIFHKWSRWTDTESGKIRKQYLTPMEWVDVGKYFIQERVCSGCGKKQARSVKVSTIKG